RLNYEWFMQTLLSRKDAMSMAWGLEMRVPFADEEIVELAYNLPWELKSLDGREKGLMRKAFEDILTPDVAWRKKSPYPKTYHPDYLRRVNELLLERLNDRGSPLHGLVNAAAVAELMRTPDILPEPWYGQLMRGPQVLAWLLTLDGWLREYKVELV
ncbi:MAG: asparagine synthase C-terminal domain-containing protein, partial [Oscillospiraceae bacterium]|nr:asparagine synthase C-terminal domain-containing protein [Oscillospiraceae bacterium]